LGPARPHEREAQRPRLRARALRRDDQLCREIGGNRVIFGLKGERYAQKIAPALKLGEPVGLALRRALAERQSARKGEDLSVVDRLVVDRGGMAPRDGFRKLVGGV